MAKDTNIHWTDATQNFWMGCHKVSEGCKNCYMFRDFERYKRDPEVVTRTKDPTFYAPLKWKEPKMIFTCSWSDFFIEEADEWRDDAWDVIRKCPQHTWQILTKRPERIAAHLPADWGEGWKHVWLGVTTENQRMADQRIPHLLAVPAQTRFLSCEPLIKPVDLTNYPTGIDWVIAGGESGTRSMNLRPAKVEWFRAIRDLCVERGVKFFFKQHGGTEKVNGVWGGNELDGQVWEQWPEATGIVQENVAAQGSMF